MPNGKRTQPQNVEIHKRARLEDLSFRNESEHIHRSNELKRFQTPEKFPNKIPAKLNVINLEIGSQLDAPPAKASQMQQADQAVGFVWTFKDAARKARRKLEFFENSPPRQTDQCPLIPIDFLPPPVLNCPASSLVSLFRPPPSAQPSSHSYTQATSSIHPQTDLQSQARMTMIPSVQSSYSNSQVPPTHQSYRPSCPPPQLSVVRPSLGSQPLQASQCLPTQQVTKSNRSFIDLINEYHRISPEKRSRAFMN